MSFWYYRIHGRLFFKDLAIASPFEMIPGPRKSFHCLISFEKTGKVAPSFILNHCSFSESIQNNTGFG